MGKLILYIFLVFAFFGVFSCVSAEQATLYIVGSAKRNIPVNRVRFTFSIETILLSKDEEQRKQLDVYEYHYAIIDQFLAQLNKMNTELIKEINGREYVFPLKRRGNSQMPSSEIPKLINVYQITAKHVDAYSYLDLYFPNVSLDKVEYFTSERQLEFLRKELVVKAVEAALIQAAVVLVPLQYEVDEIAKISLSNETDDDTVKVYELEDKIYQRKHQKIMEVTAKVTFKIKPIQNKK